MDQFSRPNPVQRQIVLDHVGTGSAVSTGADKIWLSGVECLGGEGDVGDCPHSPWGNTKDCDHSMDAPKITRRGCLVRANFVLQSSAVIM